MFGYLTRFDIEDVRIVRFRFLLDKTNRMGQQTGKTLGQIQNHGSMTEAEEHSSWEMTGT